MNVLFNKELMLDDLVYCRTLGRVVRVVGLLPYDGYNKVVVNAGGLSYNTFQAKFFETIPLNSEILERNLATCQQLTWILGWDKPDDLHIEIKNGNYAFYGICRYVHHLQHILRECYIDKEIVVTEYDLPKLGQL